MDFQKLRIELHRCCDLDDIIAWLLDHASHLCAAYGSHEYPGQLAYYNLDTTKSYHWSFMLWTSAADTLCTTFIDRVLPALGFHVVWTASSAVPMHGSDSFITLHKSDWPIMAFCDRLKA